MQTLEVETKQPVLLKIDGHEYILEYPFSSVVEAEKTTGKSLKDAWSWISLPLESLPALFKAGLLKRHPEVTLEKVQEYCEQLGPEALTDIHEALCKMAWPRTVARFEDAARKAQEGTSPNG